MNFNADQITATNQANVEALKSLSTKAYAGFEKFVELNLAASKALMSESFAHTQAVLGAKDAKQLMELQAGAAQPMADKSASYGRHVSAIATETGAEFTKAVEGKLAEAQQAFAQAMDTLTKNAPAGTESAVAVLKNALTTSQTAIESAHASAKKAMEAAETQFTAAAEQAVSAATSLGKKAK